jgi:histidyl-tRNA synthetase
MRLVTHCGGGGMKAQFKRADRSGAFCALVIGDAELERGEVIVKPLRSDQPQVAVPEQELVDALRDLGAVHPGGVE